MTITEQTGREAVERDYLVYEALALEYTRAIFSRRSKAGRPLGRAGIRKLSAPVNTAWHTFTATAKAAGLDEAAIRSYMDRYRRVVKETRL